MVYWYVLEVLMGSWIGNKIYYWTTEKFVTFHVSLCSYYLIFQILFNVKLIKGAMSVILWATNLFLFHHKPLCSQTEVLFRNITSWHQHVQNILQFPVLEHELAISVEQSPFWEANSHSAIQEIPHLHLLLLLLLLLFLSKYYARWPVTVSYFPHIWVMSVLLANNIKFILGFFCIHSVHVFLPFTLIILNIICHWFNF